MSGEKPENYERQPRYGVNVETNLEFDGDNVYIPGSHAAMEALPQYPIFKKTVESERTGEDDLNHSDKYIEDLGKLVVEAMSSYPKTSPYAKDFAIFFNKLRRMNLASLDPDKKDVEGDIMNMKTESESLIRNFYNSKKPLEQRDLQVNARVLLVQKVLSAIETL